MLKKNKFTKVKPGYYTYFWYELPEDKLKEVNYWLNLVLKNRNSLSVGYRYPKFLWVGGYKFKVKKVYRNFNSDGKFKKIFGHKNQLFKKLFPNFRNDYIK